VNARDYAEALLRELRCDEALRRVGAFLDDRTASQRLVDSGFAELTGWPDAPPIRPTRAITDAADGALAALFALSADDVATPRSATGAELLCERAQLVGLSRRGRIAPGGACRLLEASDGWLAVNLPRPDDARSLAAWLEDARFADVPAVDEEIWSRLASVLRARPAAHWALRATWLGLAVSQALSPRATPWLHVAKRGADLGARGGAQRPRVLDLSSLWAGPLAAQLLRELGAQVIKVESSRRPDGARFGSPAFFARLNDGKDQLAIDLMTAPGRRELEALLAEADIVIESARARALRQLGIEAEAWVGRRPGRVWLSITGYGRDDERVAFGDDAAVAAGSCWCVRTDAPLFLGDALADPLTGIHAALAALAHWSAGRGALLDLALARMAGYALSHVAPLP
jgi:crotonobetainyl-CoA:carnitine CoA-transferase CaiB-like acyl-CoA transferase